MRTYIFTPREREALYQWITGTLHREQDPALHATLNRLTKATLQDYLTWLTADALKDVAHSCGIAPTLTRLQEELHTQAQHNQTRNRDPTP